MALQYRLVLKALKVLAVVAFLSLLYIETRHLATRKAAVKSSRIDKQAPLEPKDFSRGVQPKSTVGLVTQRRSGKVVEGFLSYPDRVPLYMDCSDCAFVTSGGHLLNSHLGKDIDSHSCVIRSNDSPITSYGDDVGHRTTIRIVSAFSIKRLSNLVKKQPLFDPGVSSESVVIISGSTKGEEKAKLLSSILETCPDMKLYNMTSYDAHVIREYLKNIVHTSAALKHTGQTNGFVSMLFAQEVCKTVHVYGMTDPEYCPRKLAKKEADNTYYHYYEKGATECTWFARNNSGHDYKAEKELFRSWRDTRKNLYFHSPEWSE